MSSNKKLAKFDALLKQQAEPKAPAAKTAEAVVARPLAVATPKAEPAPVSATIVLPAPAGKTVLAPPAAAKPKRKTWELAELEQLQFLQDYTEVTIPQFRARFDNMENARAVLDQLISVGLVARTFRQGSGRYSLTEAGNKRIVQLSS